MNIKLPFLAATLSVALLACNNAANTNNEPSKSENPTVQQTGVVNTSEVKIAYYVQDSIATKFNFYREVDSMLKAKELNFQQELQRKIRAYQAFEADIQKRMDNNEITGYQLDGIQQTAMRKQQDIQQFQEQKGGALQMETFQYQTALMNKIAEAGKEFSKENGIDLLFFYQKGGQITFIHNAMDVTEAFISYLNQREAELKSGFEEEVQAIEQKDTTGIDPLGMQK